MSADIILNEDDTVVITGESIAATVHDIELNNESRRPGKPDGRRRALVHDFEDGLTINFGHDYTKGVTINGPLTIMDNVRIIGDVHISGDLTVGGTISGNEKFIQRLQEPLQPPFGINQ